VLVRLIGDRQHPFLSSRVRDIRGGVDEYMVGAAKKSRRGLRSKRNFARAFLLWLEVKSDGGKAGRTTST
jgi:hypothetical protein